jgi:hypothetical protein
MPEQSRVCVTRMFGKIFVSGARGPSASSADAKPRARKKAASGRVLNHSEKRGVVTGLLRSGFPGGSGAGGVDSVVRAMYFQCGNSPAGPNYFVEEGVMVKYVALGSY